MLDLLSVFSGSSCYLVTLLALEALESPKGLVSILVSLTKRARKLAKRMLKKFPNDFQLWNAYAQIEMLAGKLQDGRNVYTTALSFIDFSNSQLVVVHIDMLFLRYVLLLTWL